MAKEFTHIGTISGDARTGGRKGQVYLRLTPSGSHWVDSRGRKYKRYGGGYVGDQWPMWFLDAGSIRELLPAQGMETRQGGDGTAPSQGDDSPVGTADAPTGG